MVYSFTYTLHHLLIIKLLMPGIIKEERTIHNLLFLAVADSEKREKPGLKYDFYRCRQGVYSFEVSSILADLQESGMIDSFEVTPEGEEFLHQVGILLRYESFPEHCLDFAGKYGKELWKVNHQVFFHPLFRRARPGRKLELWQAEYV